MNIWKLTPINIEHESWAHSRPHKTVIIRAESEVDARTIANGAFCTAIKLKSGRSVQYVPWSNSDLVACVALMKDTDDANDGEQMILYYTH